LTAVESDIRGALWSSGEDIYQEILAHPFLVGLTDGTLDGAAFRHYLIQDSLYLRFYARALLLLSKKAPSQDIAAMFSAHAQGAIAAECGLHAELLASSGPGGSADLDEPVAGPTAGEEDEAPTTVAYTRYLLTVIHEGTFAEGVAAVLPCYWIYAEVGAALRRLSSPNPLYARWIEMYSSEEFAVVVEDVLRLVDSLAPRCSGEELELMRRRFRMAARYEWMFWDAAYRREQWPV